MRECLPSALQRARFWEDLFDGPAADLAMSGHMDGAMAAARALIDHNVPSNGGEIHHLHVESGDPDLLTVRAARLIRMADILIHEAAVEGAILGLARRDALKIPAQIDGPSDSTRELESLENWAHSGRLVVYLRASR